MSEKEDNIKDDRRVDNNEETLEINEDLEGEREPKESESESESELVEGRDNDHNKSINNKGENNNHSMINDYEEGNDNKDNVLKNISEDGANSNHSENVELGQNNVDSERLSVSQDNKESNDQSQQANDSRRNLISEISKESTVFKIQKRNDSDFTLNQSDVSDIKDKHHLRLKSNIKLDNRESIDNRLKGKDFTIKPFRYEANKLFSRNYATFLHEDHNHELQILSFDGCFLVAELYLSDALFVQGDVVPEINVYIMDELFIKSSGRISNVISTGYSWIYDISILQGYRDDNGGEESSMGQNERIFLNENYRKHLGSSDNNTDYNNNLNGKSGVNALRSQDDQGNAEKSIDSLSSDEDRSYPNNNDREFKYLEKEHLVEEAFQLLHNQFGKLDSLMEKIDHLPNSFVIAINKIERYLSYSKDILSALELKIGIMSLEEDELNKIYVEFEKKMNELFDNFEKYGARLSIDLQSYGHLLARKSLHKFFLNTPFGYRSYEKPLGHPGDHGVMEYVRGNPFQGKNLFYKVLNAWIIKSSLGDAVRERIKVLEKYLYTQAQNSFLKGKRMTMLSIGCGDVKDIIDFLEHSRLSDIVDFNLVDYHPETLRNAKKKLNYYKKKNLRNCTFNFYSIDVNKLVKIGKNYNAQKLNDLDDIDDDMKGLLSNNYDYICCTGLFDYLPDRICCSLIDMFIKMGKENGIILVSNVTEKNTEHSLMKYIFDWGLLYRNNSQLENVLSDQAKKILLDSFTLKNGIETYLSLKK